MFNITKTIFFRTCWVRVRINLIAFVAMIAVVIFSNCYCRTLLLALLFSLLLSLSSPRCRVILMRHDMTCHKLVASDSLASYYIDESRDLIKYFYGDIRRNVFPKIFENPFSVSFINGHIILM